MSSSRAAGAFHQLTRVAIRPIFHAIRIEAARPAQEGHDEVVTALLKVGAEKNRAVRRGSTAFA